MSGKTGLIGTNPTLSDDVAVHLRGRVVLNTSKFYVLPAVPLRFYVYVFVEELGKPFETSFYADKAERERSTWGAAFVLFRLLTVLALHPEWAPRYPYCDWDQ